MIFSKLAPLVLFSTAALAMPMTTDLIKRPRKIGKRCTGTISSYASVAAAVECTTIVISVYMFHRLGVMRVF